MARAGDRGSDDYVTKPFSSQWQLVARITRGAAKLRRGSSEREGRSERRSRRAGAENDVDRHECDRGGSPRSTVPLKEFDLTEIAAAERGRVLDADAAHRPECGGPDYVGDHQDARRAREAAAAAR
ncbi:hypothetical protein GCM10023238_24050 [Streptomyces heliomycini]